MAKVLLTESSLENIADAIRYKLRVGTVYTPSEMANAIMSIIVEADVVTDVSYSNGVLSKTKDGTTSTVFTADSTPTSASTNPLTSGGAYNALASKQDAVVVGSLSLTTTWIDNGEGVYSQSVSITGATATSKIDIQPDTSVLAQMINDRVIALGVANDNGTVTIFAYGHAPTVALTVQYTRMEVSA